MGRVISFYSSYLFALSGHIGGAARLFDFQGSLNTYNYSSTGVAADRKALYCDWKAIGEDLRSALENYKSQQEGHECEKA